VVITGVGAVSPNGIGAAAFHAACLAGRSGVRRLNHIDTTGLKSSAAAQVIDFEAASVMDAPEARRVPRMVHLALAASREALANALLASSVSNDLAAQREVGVALGTGGGGLAFVEDQFRSYFAEGRMSLYSITGGTHGNLSSELSIALHLRGPSHVLSTGCASSTDAIGYALMLIRCGVVPVMLAGGADAPISPGILRAFENMKVVSTRRWDDPARASRPFSRDRDGFVLGEGAWMLVLESLEHALERGAPIIAEVAGYASTCDAYHRVQIAPEILEPVRAIELALLDAGAATDDVGYINLHGTGTELNDRMETAALRKCFGDRAIRIPMSATKSMIGHPQGACGAAGIVTTALSLASGVFHPSINVEEADPACDLDYMTEGARALDVELALCNCIAFGSKNSALVLRKWSA
jgi:3-oxoacyl-[acyl-carrier-protein] synthase II